MKKFIIAICFATVLSLGAEEKNSQQQKLSDIGWSSDFSMPAGASETDKICPAGWEIKGKIGTPNAEFYLKKNGEGQNCLYMSADKASASIVSNPTVDLKKYPILAWKWKADTLPVNGDGRKSETD
ncbi:MAG: DUF3047 domain-containing protein, partial [Candidatus Nanoarchaeia archaeon]